ncbi:hypothetical protein CLAIMM_04318 [Cladophialophora immunda]|nr:hypothetical protein CLAIMM_04318 [Cladophialophora immunda]
MSPSTSTITAGRVCLSLVAAITSIGCYLADWNETHVKNPRWPPHARFHNGQTMSMGLCLGVLTAYFTWRPVLAASSSLTTDEKLNGGGGGGGGGGPTAKRKRKSESGSGIGEKECVTIAAVLGSLYYVTGISGILYPGTKWVDPEFGDGAPQVPIFVGAAGLAWCGWWLEMRRLAQAEKLA